MNLSFFQNARFLNVVLLVTVLTGQTVASSTDYDFMGQRDAILLGGGGAVLTLGFVLEKKVQAPDPGQLRPEQIPFWDATALKKDNRTAEKISDWGMAFCSLMPLIALLDAPENQRAVSALMAAESVIWTTGVTYMVKSTVKRARPYAYHVPPRPLTRESSLSFFSGHTAISFQGAVLGGILLQSGVGDKRLRNIAGLSGLGIALLTGICRIESGNHFPSDVLAGAVAGSLIGWLIPELHKSNTNSESKQPASRNGLKIQLTIPL